MWFCSVVFQSKVLQKLYPSPPKPDQIPNTPPTLTTVSKKPKVQHESGEHTATESHYVCEFIGSIFSPHAYFTYSASGPWSRTFSS